jgi:hypothetical protein
MAAQKSERKVLREFGLTLGIAFGVLAGIFLLRGRSHYVYFVWPAGVFIVAGLVAPVVLRPIRRGWMTAAGGMGWVMTRVILTVLFFGVFTPIGVIARLAGKRFLHLSAEPSAESYWVKRDPSASEPGALERQF